MKVNYALNVLPSFTMSVTTTTIWRVKQIRTCRTFSDKYISALSDTHDRTKRIHSNS